MPSNGWPLLVAFVLSSRRPMPTTCTCVAPRRMQTGFKQHVLSGACGKGDAKERMERVQNLVGLLQPAAQLVLTTQLQSA